MRRRPAPSLRRMTSSCARPGWSLAGSPCERPATCGSGVLPQEISQRAVHLVGMSQAGGVSSARYHDQVHGPGQAIAEHLPQRQRDRLISLAMHNQGRLSDLAEAGRDVVGTHEHGHRVG
jgi:hypothetical protein